MLACLSFREFNMTPLDLSPLEKALAALDRGLRRALAAPSDEELRDACIQRFEFCFELSWKMLKRRLERDLPSPDEIDGMNYRNLIRVGAEYGLISNVSDWFLYREKRNITSHHTPTMRTRQPQCFRYFRTSLLTPTHCLQRCNARGRMMPDLSHEDAAITRVLLAKHFPGRQVLVFGSRARGNAKPWSDLDMAILGQEEIDELALADARHDFEESDLTFRVDLVAFQELPRSLRQIVLKEGTPIN